MRLREYLMFNKRNWSDRTSFRRGLRKSLILTLWAIRTLALAQLVTLGRFKQLLLLGRFHVAQLYASFFRELHEDSLKTALGLPLSGGAKLQPSEQFHQLVRQGAMGLEYRQTFRQI